MTQQEILDKNGIGGGHFEYRNQILQSMDDWAAQKEADYLASWIQKETYSPQNDTATETLESFRSQIIGLRAFFKKGSPLVNMLDKIIKDHE